MSTTGQKLLAEALGTALLVTTVVGSGIMADTLAGGNVALALLGNTIATGAMLVVLIVMFAPVSGAHFNPVVTLVMALMGRLGWPFAGLFVLSQIAGGLAGTALAHMMFEQPVLQAGIAERTGISQWLAETVASFGLVGVILATLRTRPDHVALSVGLYITAAYWFTASTSFANPAVTIARAATASFSGIRPEDVAAFILAQIIGALLAMGAMRLIFADRPSETEERLP